MSELTLATIQSKVSVSAYEQLAREFTDEALQEMSSSGGLTLTKNHNVQMGWHTNTAGEIDGVFLRMLSEDSLGMRTWLIGDAPPDAPWMDRRISVRIPFKTSRYFFDENSTTSQKP
jgi:hypothetical protein